MVVHLATHRLFRLHYEAGLLPQNADVLDIGQVEWSGSAEGLLDDIIKYTQGERHKNLRAGLLQAAIDHDMFAIGRIYYDIFFSPARYDAIDLHGTEEAIQIDLNYPAALGRQYDVVVNNGTAEHVFNLAQVFRTIHEHTRPGGLMIHETPFTGCFNHGFIAAQPVLFFDMAAANGYRVVSSFVCSHGDGGIRQLTGPYEVQSCIWPDTVLVNYLRKGDEETEFVIPQQGKYAK
jgi:SAM-dependent methyltransferase